MFLLLLQLCRGQRVLNHTVVSARPLKKIHRFQFPNTCLHFEKRLIFYSNQKKQNQSHSDTTSRKYSLIAGTTACAALMSSFVVSNPNIHINIWHAHSGSYNNNNNSPKNDGINSNQLPLFMPHKPIVTNGNDAPSDNNNNNTSNFLNINNNNNKQSELNDLKLQLIYNYARQCRILGKPTKESMIDWLETEIEKHNNFINNNSNNNNNNNNNNDNNTNENTKHKHDKFKLDKSSVYLGNIDETGQRYLLYTIINENNTNERYQYIVIRGTKNWKNMKSHMKSELIYDDSFGMYLHSGYSDATHKILNDIIQHIDTNCKLRLTGHSYGGVLCTLLGYYLSCVNENLDNNNNNNNGNGNTYKSNVRYNIEQIVTFGMPEFADKESSFNLVHNNINLPLIRVEHINDYIARFDWNRYNQLRIKNLVLNKLVNKIKKNNNNNKGGNETTVSKQFIKTIAAMRYTPDDINDTSIATGDTAAATAEAASIGIFERNNNKYSNNNHIQYGAAKRYTKDKNENGKSVNQVFYVGIDDSDDTLTGQSTNDTSVKNTRQDIAAVRGMTSLFTNSLKNMNNFELSKYFISRPRCIHRMRDYQIAIESQLFNNGCTNSSTPVSSSSD